MPDTGEPGGENRRARGIPPGKAHTGGKKGARKPSQLLRDLRHVYKSKASEADTPAQVALRKMWTESPERFIAQLQRAEQAHRAGAGKPGAALPTEEREKATEEVDAGSERVEGLIERLLSEWDREAR